MTKGLTVFSDDGIKSMQFYLQLILQRGYEGAHGVMPIKIFSQNCSVVSGAGAKIALTLYYCYVSEVSSRNVRMKANALPLMLPAIILLSKSTEERRASLFM